MPRSNDLFTRMSLASRQARSCASSAEWGNTLHIRKPLEQGSQALTLAIIEIDDLDVMGSTVGVYCQDRTLPSLGAMLYKGLLFTTIPFTYTCFCAQWSQKRRVSAAYASLHESHRYVNLKSLGISSSGGDWPFLLLQQCSNGPILDSL